MLFFPQRRVDGRILARWSQLQCFGKASESHILQYRSVNLIDKGAYEAPSLKGHFSSEILGIKFQELKT